MKRKTLDEFKDELYLINPSIEIIGEYINTDTGIDCKCKICGNTWNTPPRGLLQGTGCPKCAASKKHRLSDEEAKKRIEVARPNLIVIGKYNGAHKPIKCFCKIHNISFESYFCNLQNKSTNCPECSKDKIKQISRLSQEEFETILSTTHPHIIPKDTYINRETEILFHCITHNVDFIAKPKAFIYKKSRGCPYCVSSIGENKMISILENMGFNVERQFIFDECKFIKPLPFDGFIKEIRTAFEYQGEQHYKVVNFNGHSSSNEIFELGLKRDKIKEEYCKKNGINLIKVPYWELDNMETYIENEIKQIQ